MVDNLIPHPRTRDDIANDAYNVEQMGEEAIRSSGTTRQTLVSQIHDFLRAMTADERASFYTAFDDQTNKKATPPYVNGQVTIGYSGPLGGTVPGGLEFHAGPFLDMLDWVTGKPQNEIFIPDK